MLETLKEIGGLLLYAVAVLAFFAIPFLVIISLMDRHADRSRGDGLYSKDDTFECPNCGQSLTFS